jgi:Anthrax toxin LF subunit
MEFRAELTQRASVSRFKKKTALIRRRTQYNPCMTSPYLGSSGMTPDHFSVFQLVAGQVKLIVVVRNTNRKSTPWIAKGYPPKPISIKSHTSDKTGKVTAAKGRNITLVTSNGAVVPNRTSPDVERVRNAVNPRLDQARVMHGAQDQFAGAPDKDGSSAFLPNGLVVELTSPQRVIEFYQLLGREFITGKY